MAAVTNPRAAAIISGVVAIGQSLGLRVVAEGIENSQQLISIQGLGCNVVQGFLFEPAAQSRNGTMNLLREHNRGRTNPVRGGLTARTVVLGGWAAPRPPGWVSSPPRSTRARSPSDSSSRQHPRRRAERVADRERGAGPAYLHALGVQVLISGDAQPQRSDDQFAGGDGDGRLEAGAIALPSLTTPLLDPKPPEQFGGSVFDLSPALQTSSSCTPPIRMARWTSCAR